MTGCGSRSACRTAAAISFPTRRCCSNRGSTNSTASIGARAAYIGQELTARMKYRGLVKRRLLPVRIDGPVPAPGTPVMAEGREVGEMRSARDGLGLALLRLEALAGNQRLAAGAAAIVPTPPGWMRLSEGAASPGEPAG